MNISLIENFLLTELPKFFNDENEREDVIVLLPNKLEYEFKVYSMLKNPWVKIDSILKYFNFELHFIHFENEVVIYNKTKPQETIVRYIL